MIMPAEYTAGIPRDHDPGDEDPGEKEQRMRIRAVRQAWKADTFFARHAMPIGTGARALTRPAVPCHVGPGRHSLDSDSMSPAAMQRDRETRQAYDVAMLRPIVEHGTSASTPARPFLWASGRALIWYRRDLPTDGATHRRISRGWISATYARLMKKMGGFVMFEPELVG